jgi:hypothetical protein
MGKKEVAPKNNTLSKKAPPSLKIAGRVFGILL